MNSDFLLKLASENYGANAESLTTQDLADFAKFVLEEKERRDMIRLRRENCMTQGHVFHWTNQDYEMGATEIGAGVVTVTGWKVRPQKCDGCDGVLGVVYPEGVI